MISDFLRSINCFLSPKIREYFITMSSHCRFSILQKGPKLLYLNTCIRGYPKGLRGGSDPRKPLISVDEHFEKIEYRSTPSELFAIEVNIEGFKKKNL